MGEQLFFKLISYFKPNFKTNTQEVEYFIQFEDGTEKALADILKENIEYKDTIENNKMMLASADMYVCDLREDISEKETTIEKQKETINYMNDSITELLNHIKKLRENKEVVKEIDGKIFIKM